MLKQLMKLTLLWLLPFVISANHVHWLGDYNVALQQAHKEQKPLFVLVIKKDSTLSSQIVKNYFMNQTYVEYINKKMIPVIVRYEGLLSYPVEMYYTTVFPTLFLVDSKREIFYSKPLYGKEINKESIDKMLE